MVDSLVPPERLSSEEEAAVVKRILDMRRRDCELLNTSILAKIVQEKWQQLLPRSKETDVREQYVVLLKLCFERAADEALPPSKRRLAFESIKTMFHELDSNLAALNNRAALNVSPLHSPLEDLAQPSATRPGVHEPRENRSPSLHNSDASESPSPAWRTRTASRSSSSSPQKPHASSSKTLPVGWGNIPRKPASQQALETNIPGEKSTSITSKPNGAVPAPPVATSSKPIPVGWGPIPASLNTSAVSSAATSSKPIPVGWGSIPASLNTPAVSNQAPSERNAPLEKSTPSLYRPPPPNQNAPLSRGIPVGWGPTHAPLNKPLNQQVPETNATTATLKHYSSHQPNNYNAPSAGTSSKAAPVGKPTYASLGKPSSSSQNGYDNRAFAGTSSISQAKNNAGWGAPQIPAPGQPLLRNKDSRPAWMSRSSPYGAPLPSTMSTSREPALQNKPDNRPAWMSRSSTAPNGAPLHSRGIHGTASASVNAPTASVLSSTHEPSEKSAFEQFLEFDQPATVLNIQTINFPPDLGVPVGTKFKTRSGLLDMRPHRLSVRCRPERLTSALTKGIDKRIREWEPYRKPLAYVSMGLTSHVEKCEPAGLFARTAARIQLDLTKTEIKLTGNISTELSNYPGINWGSKAENGTELVLIMLPLNRSDKDQKKRADGHLWPKGSFLVAQNSPCDLQQRRQENHDKNLWKGSSYPLDVGSLIKDPSQPVNIDLCCYDDDPFIYCVMICSVQTPEKIYCQLTGPGPTALQRMSREELMDMAVDIAKRQVIQLDCDDDMEPELGRLVFSLLCPMSMTIMETPVRSKNCNHWQCFDLKFFLQTNQHIGGARWRCGACDPRFVSPSELHICGLTADLIQEFKNDVSSLRNRVELVEDRTYRLLSATKARNRGGVKRVMATDGTNNSTTAKKTQPREEIVIDDDD